MKPKKFCIMLILVAVLFVSSSAFADDVYNLAPTFSPYYAGSVKISVLNEALQELNYIRGLIGVPNNITLNNEYTNKAQHGAVLLDAINTLTHTPSKPSDMSESFYELAYDATTHSNLAWGLRIVNGVESGNMTLIKAIQGCMDDSDDSNISALGHRRWFMNPRLKQTGFGISTRRGYAAIYVIEEFGKSGTLTQEEYAQYLQWLRWLISDEFITWPTRKNLQPRKYFDANTAWSVTLNHDVFDTIDENNIRVTLTRLRDGKIWNFTQLSQDGFFKVSHEGYAYDECIIFRPDNISGYENGDTWHVEISGLTRKDGGRGDISYTVSFTGEAKPEENNTRYTVKEENNSGCNNSFVGLYACLIFGIPSVFGRLENK